MGGKPVPFTKMCVHHIPQIMLERFCTCTQGCHYSFWTPVGTKDFLVDKDDSYIELLLNYLYKLIHFVNVCVAFGPLIAVIIPGLARTEINHSKACNKCIVVQFQKKTENGRPLRFTEASVLQFWRNCLSFFN